APRPSSGQHQVPFLRNSSGQLDEVETQDGTLPTHPHRAGRTRRGSIEIVLLPLDSPDRPIYQGAFSDEILLDLPLDRPCGTSSRCQPYVANAVLAQASNIGSAVASTVVGIRARSLAEKPNQIFDGTDSEV